MLEIDKSIQGEIAALDTRVREEEVFFIAHKHKDCFIDPKTESRDLKTG